MSQMFGKAGHKIKTNPIDKNHYDSSIGFIFKYFVYIYISDSLFNRKMFLNRFFCVHTMNKFVICVKNIQC